VKDVKKRATASILLRQPWVSRHDAKLLNYEQVGLDGCRWLFFSLIFVAFVEGLSDCVALCDDQKGGPEQRLKHEEEIHHLIQQQVLCIEQRE
jgi:hypothetical protein